jgi:hypothetical protein
VGEKLTKELVRYLLEEIPANELHQICFNLDEGDEELSVYLLQPHVEAVLATLEIK